MAAGNNIDRSKSASILGILLLVVYSVVYFVTGPTLSTSLPLQIYNPTLYLVDNMLLSGAGLLLAGGLLGWHTSPRAGSSKWIKRAGLLTASIAAVFFVIMLVGTLQAVLGSNPAYALLTFLVGLLGALCLVGSFIALLVLGLTKARETPLQKGGRSRRVQSSAVADAQRGDRYRVDEERIENRRAPRRDHEGDAAAAEQVRQWMPNVQKREVTLILGAILVAALFSELLEQILLSTLPGGLKGTHVLHVILTVPAALWIARKIGKSPVWYGVLTGLASAIVNQITDHVVLASLGLLGRTPITLKEVVIISILCVGAGWIGGLMAKALLSTQEAIYQASQAIINSRSPQEVVDAIGEHLYNQGVSHVACWHAVSPDENDQPIMLELLAAWTPPVAKEIWGAEAWRPGLRLNTSKVPTLASSLRQNLQQSIRVSKLLEPERSVWEHQGVNSFMLLPLTTASEEQRGLLMIASRKTAGFFRTTERLYQTVGSQTALALENLRLIEQAQQAGIVTERQRLAHDIHDTLAQGFSSIVMNLEVAEGMFSDDPRLSRQHIDQARSIARENLAEARRLMWALQPSSLDDASLPEALRRLTKRHSTECNADAHAAINGTPYSLSPDIELTVLRVAQEALANCRKHARARHVWVTLSYMNNLVSLNVQDDGVGFDPNQRHTSSSDHSGGVGLTSMRQRVEQLGGTILLQSTPGKGATLMAALPVTESNQGDQRTEDAEGNPAGRGLYDGEH